jgi:hypothetical protein
MFFFIKSLQLAENVKIRSMFLFYVKLVVVRLKGKEGI